MENIKVLIGKINEQIIAPIILLLFVLSLAYFFWGIADYIRGSGNEQIRKVGRDHMIWGLVGIFIMVSAWAIIKILLSSVGAPDPVFPSNLF
ncbi:MAG: hypothetical protein KAJ58_01450 [Candidatus Pacebacteria bacterium]|nr:hypothetical protein [Candidatus Paceibacterota bacterium]